MGSNLNGRGSTAQDVSGALPGLTLLEFGLFSDCAGSCVEELFLIR